MGQKWKANGVLSLKAYSKGLYTGDEGEVKGEEENMGCEMLSCPMASR